MIDKFDDQKEMNKVLVSKIIRQNAFALSALFIIILTVTHFFREQLMDISRYFWIFFMAIMLVFAIITQTQVREKAYGGLIKFSDAFVSGFKMVLWVAVIYAIFNFIFYTLIFPDADDEMLRMAEQSMRESGSTEEEIEMGLRISKFFFSPLGILIGNMVVYPLMGAIDSVIGALFTQRTKK